MKKIILVTSLFLSTASFAQTADELKEASLAACETQAASMPEAQRGMITKMCKCGVENTDYELMLASQGNPEAAQKAQAQAMEIAQKCSAMPAN